MKGDLSLRMIFQTPSPVMVVLRSINNFFLSAKIFDYPSKRKGDEGKDEQSRKVVVKLMQTFPSQMGFRRFLIIPGIFFVSTSSRRRRIPCLLRKPTMIFGTPKRNDWAQNLSSFRSNLTMSWSLSISAEVLSSTQLIGTFSLSGLQSQTGRSLTRNLKRS